MQVRYKRTRGGILHIRRLLGVDCHVLGGVHISVDLQRQGEGGGMQVCSHAAH